MALSDAELARIAALPDDATRRFLALPPDKLVAFRPSRTPLDRGRVEPAREQCLDQLLAPPCRRISGPGRRPGWRRPASGSGAGWPPPLLAGSSFGTRRDADPWQRPFQTPTDAADGPPGPGARDEHADAPLGPLEDLRCCGLLVHADVGRVLELVGAGRPLSVRHGEAPTMDGAASGRSGKRNALTTAERELVKLYRALPPKYPRRPREQLPSSSCLRVLEGQRDAVALRQRHRKSPSTVLKPAAPALYPSAIGRLLLQNVSTNVLSRADPRRTSGSAERWSTTSLVTSTTSIARARDAITWKRFRLSSNASHLSS